jgi:FKBP-type peptidyl-prolyl cis-trans isomerase
MKKYFLLLLTAPLFLFSCSQNTEKEVVLENNEDSTSYALGYDDAKYFMEKGFEVNTDAYMKGMLDYLNGFETLDSQERTRQIIIFQNTIREIEQIKQQESMQKIAEPVLAAGQEFLDKNKERDEITVMPSGLQYEVLQEGEGESPQITDKVKVHFIFSLYDGTEIVSTYDTEPAEFDLSRVIPGFREGVMLMNKGAKYKLYIPSDLGYGLNVDPQGPIPPGATLVYEVELIDFSTPEQPQMQFQE